MANIRQTLYAGVTSNLIKRVYEHKNNLAKGFTSKYNLHKLVYYEVFDTIEQAIIREKQIKDMNRIDKLDMINKFNPKFEDLYSVILGTNISEDSRISRDAGRGQHDKDMINLD